MEIKVNREKLVKDCEEVIAISSPVSYYEEIHPYLEKKAKEYGLEVHYDRKRTAYISLEGEDPSKTVCVGAHVDTIGLIVRRIEKDGTLVVRQLGGVNYHSLEGEGVRVHTRDGRCYTGMIIHESHSVHVFENARTADRDEKTMRVLLDKDVHSEADVLALGIQHGDIVDPDARFTYTEDGYIRSRYIDDKACVACLFATLDYLKENNLKPKYNTLFAFPIYEEIGHGGAWVPTEVSEYVALDIGLVGPDYYGSEKKVSICAADAYSPYDRGLTNHIIEKAKKINLDYALDVFYRYSTDANAAIRGGNNVYAAAFGMGCMSSHGMERTHICAIEDTAKLTIAYVLDL